MRDVVINDSLGLAEELEQEMWRVVSTFECEWKATLNNPEKLRRFMPFVNTDESDLGIAFELVRGQVQPL